MQLEQIGVGSGAVYDRSQHTLCMQIFPHFINGIIPMSRDFPTHHGPALPDSGGGFGVGRVVQRTFPLIAQSVIIVGGYFNGLFNGHYEVSIA